MPVVETEPEKRKPLELHAETSIYVELGNGETFKWEPHEGASICVAPARIIQVNCSRIEFIRAVESYMRAEGTGRAGRQAQRARFSALSALLCTPLSDPAIDDDDEDDDL